MKDLAGVRQAAASWQVAAVSENDVAHAFARLL